MKNILTESIDSLRLYAPKLSSRKLVEMVRALQVLLNEGGEKQGQERVTDIVRRQAILEGVLVSRGYLKQGQDNHEFQGMLKKQAPKRLF